MRAATSSRVKHIGDAQPPTHGPKQRRRVNDDSGHIWHLLTGSASDPREVGVSPGLKLSEWRICDVFRQILPSPQLVHRNSELNQRVYSIMYCFVSGHSAIRGYILKYSQRAVKYCWVSVLDQRERVEFIRSLSTSDKRFSSRRPPPSDS